DAQIIQPGNTQSGAPAAAANATNNSAIQATLTLGSGSPTPAAVLVASYTADPSPAGSSANGTIAIGTGTISGLADPVAFYDVRIAGVTAGTGASTQVTYTFVVANDQALSVEVLYFNGMTWTPVLAPEQRTITLDTPQSGSATVELTTTYND